MIQTRFEGANRAHRKANNLIFQSYVYVLYPMSAVAFCASIYMTLAVTVERRVNNFLTFPYKTCCKTHQKRGEQPVSDETFSMRNWLEEKSWEVLVNSLNRSYITSCSDVFGCDSSPRSPNVSVFVCLCVTLAYNCTKALNSNVFRHTLDFVTFCWLFDYKI